MADLISDDTAATDPQGISTDASSSMPAAETMAQVVAGALAGDAAQKSNMKREPGEIDQARKSQVTKLIDNIKADKAFWDKKFKRMRYDMRFAAGKNQWPNQRENDVRYLVNLVQKHIKNRVSAIYAKNPTIVAKRRPQVKYKLWDGAMASYQAAQQLIQQVAAAQTQVAQAAAAAGAPPPPPPPPEQIAGAQALIAEVHQVALADQQIDKIGETAEILFNYFAKEQEPSFKRGMKRVVRRAKTCSVGYVRLQFQRVNGRDPGDEQGLIDSKRRLEAINQVRADIQDGELNKDSPEAEQLKQQIAATEAKQEIVLREGLVFDWPYPTRVIPHRACTQLDGFLGAEWVSIEHPMTVERVKQVYGVDLGTNYQAYTTTQDGRMITMPPTASYGPNKMEPKSLVWEQYHRPTGLMYTLCDGYPDYLAEPEAPCVQLERFYPIYAYVPGELEEEDDPFPPSDVRLLESAQIEYNRTRESLRQHRIANRPLYIAPESAFQKTTEKDEHRTMANHDAHEILTIQGLAIGQKAEDLVQPMKKTPIDPAAYETDSIFNDTLRTTGDQELDFGGAPNGQTATATADASSVKMTSVADDIDSLDMMLSDIARDASKIMLKEVSPQTAIKYAGRGAVWPQLSAQDIAEELYLDILAGSSGRPNRSQEIADFTRMQPLLIQIPGINPEWVARRAVRIIDPNVDLSEAITEGLPSIMVINGQAQPSSGAPAQNPNAQGAYGGGNAAQPPGVAPGPQPAFPNAPVSQQSISAP